MRDRVIQAGFWITKYEAYVHLLETIWLIEQRLAQTIFDELLEINSNGRQDINYGRYRCRLVHTWRYRLSLRTKARRLRFDAKVYENLARPYLNWATEYHELTYQIIEEAGDDDLDEEQIGWTDAHTRSEKTGPVWRHQVGNLLTLDLAGDRKSRRSNWIPIHKKCWFLACT